MIKPTQQEYGSTDEILNVKLQTRNVLDTLVVGRYQLMLFFSLGLLFMSDSVESSLIGYLYECAGDTFGLSPGYASTIVSIVFAGEFISGLIVGVLSDVLLGRSTIILLASFLLVAFGLISAASPNYQVLIAARFVVGLGLGMFVVPFDLGIEFCPAPARGKLIQLINCFWGLGAAYITGCAWIILSSTGSWRILIIAAVIPAAIAFGLLLYLIRESPLYLVENKKYDQAFQVLSEIAHFNHDTTSETTQALNTFKNLMHQGEEERGQSSLLRVKEDNAIPPPTNTIFAILTAYKTNIIELHRSYSHTVFIIDTIWFIMGLSFYGTNLLTTLLFTRSSGGLKCSFDYRIIFIIYSGEIFGSLVVLSIIDTFGRKCTLGFVTIGVALCMAPIAISNTVLNSVPALIICLMGASACVIGFGNTLFILTPEIFPTHLRATGHTLAYAISRIGCALATFFVDDILPVRGSAVGIAGLCFIAALLSFKLDETKGIQLN
mmetsp:Transcript_23359/g.30307  ORF Transcript_23359/g.30307 Transcript_23359/m.30307 type:complete len:493 (-) Transcript_23359:1021-2499(-)